MIALQVLIAIAMALVLATIVTHAHKLAKGPCDHHSRGTKVGWYAAGALIMACRITVLVTLTLTLRGGL